MIEAAWGRHLMAVLSSLSERPISAASLGQVRGCDHAGFTVNDGGALSTEGGSDDLVTVPTAFRASSLKVRAST